MYDELKNTKDDNTIQVIAKQAESVMIIKLIQSILILEVILLK